MKKFICPLCSEVAISGYDSLKCPVCGTEMTSITGSLLARIPDRPGGLAALSQKLAEKGINITSLRIIAKQGDEAIAIFTVDRLEEALKIEGVQRADEHNLPLQHLPSLPQE